MAHLVPFAYGVSYSVEYPHGLSVDVLALGSRFVYCVGSNRDRCASVLKGLALFSFYVELLGGEVPCLLGGSHNSFDRSERWVAYVGALGEFLKGCFFSLRRWEFSGSLLSFVLVSLLHGILLDEGIGSA